jgi:hypothetical protein
MMGTTMMVIFVPHHARLSRLVLVVVVRLVEIVVEEVETWAIL